MASQRSERGGGRVRQAIRFLIPVTVLAAGLLPMVMHHIQVGQIHNDLAVMMVGASTTPEAVFRERVARSVRRIAVPFEPDDVVLERHPESDQIRCVVAFDRSVRVMFLFDKTYHVQIEETATDLGL